MENMILEVVSSLCVAVLTGGLSILIAFLQSKIKSERINSCLSRLETLSSATVADLKQNYVDEWKKKGGGRLTSEQVQRLKALSYTQIRALLDDPAAKLIESAGMDLQQLIQAFVERNVQKMKARDALA